MHVNGLEVPGDQREKTPRESQDRTVRSENPNLSQNSFLLIQLKNLPYPESLRWLKLPCLEHRRKRGDVIEVYKYLHGFYKVSRPDFHIARNVMRSTRCNSLKLLKPRHRLNVRGNYFANRVVNLWNSLPDNVVTAPSVDSFKRRLDKHWAALPSMYDPECLA